ncbi:hypothetical protein KGM_206456B, partial [Danaus plexippus plexippus]
EVAVMEFQYYGNFERRPRRLNDQPWWDEEDNLTDRHLNGKLDLCLFDGQLENSLIRACLS